MIHSLLKPWTNGVASRPKRFSTCVHLRLRLARAGLMLLLNYSFAVKVSAIRKSTQGLAKLASTCDSIWPRLKPWSYAKAPVKRTGK